MNKKEWIEDRAKSIIRNLAMQHGMDIEETLRTEKCLFWDICVAMDDATNFGSK